MKEMTLFYDWKWNDNMFVINDKVIDYFSTI